MSGSSSGTTTLPPYLFDAAVAAEEARAAEEAKKEARESLWNPEFLRTTKGMLLVAQVVSHPFQLGASLCDVCKYAEELSREK